MPRELLSRRVRERHTGPYQAAVPPHIATQAVSLPSDVATLADEASVEISRFDAEMGADLAPFGALLLRTESASSSQIEQLTSSARAIALAELEHSDRANAVAIVANVRAMEAAIALADRLDTAAVREMHAVLMAHDARHEPGQWRTEPVWIGGTSVGPHLADFVAPHHERVPGLMADLMAFVQRDDLPVLVQAALAHAQFETIHPFTDGNGRTGRALVHALLRARGLTRHVTVPVSAGLLTDTGQYFAALTEYRRGDAAPIIRQVAEAALTALANGRRLVADLTDIRQRWEQLITARRDAVVWRLVEFFLRQPVADVHAAEGQLGAGTANVHRALRQLAEAGVVTEVSGRRRARVWQAPEVLSALDDFAARAGRRGV